MNCSSRNAEHGKSIVGLYQINLSQLWPKIDKKSIFYDITKSIFIIYLFGAINIVNIWFSSNQLHSFLGRSAEDSNTGRTRSYIAAVVTISEVWRFHSLICFHVCCAQKKKRKKERKKGGIHACLLKSAAAKF